MINLNDTIKEPIDSAHYRTKYRATCDTCGKDRGYLNKVNASKPNCTKCCIRHTTESKLKMSLAKVNHVPWNKGKKETRREVIDKMSAVKRGRSPTNKGKKLTFDQKVKISCTLRGIKLSDFDELKTPAARAERNRFADLKLHVERFKVDNFTCVACSISGVTLNAHHVKSWKHHPTERFNIDNLVSLCIPCHRLFHAIHGNGKEKPNTKDQMENFLANRSVGTKKIVYVIAGASGAGKSWICNQVINKFKYVSYDKTPKDQTRSILWNETSTVIYDPTTHVSSFIKRNKDIFDIKLIVIVEDELTISTRLMARGGQITNSVRQRIKRMKNLAKGAVFSGTSSEVLAFLRTV